MAQDFWDYMFNIKLAVEPLHIESWITVCMYALMLQEKKQNGGLVD